MKNINWKELAGLLGLMVLIFFLWNTWFVYPLKILVVFFHEMSHGLVAILTGGKIIEIQVVAAQGGVCVTLGGNRFLTLTAGYLGSLVWGGLILVLAAKTRYDREIAFALGVLMVLVSLIWVRPFASFGFGFGLGSGIALVASGFYLSERLNDFFLKVVGLTSCMYAVLDIKSDILDRPSVRSDAAMLAEETGIPTMVWGVLWIVVASVAALYFLRLASKIPEASPVEGE